MSSFAQFQHKRAKASSSVEQPAQILQSSRSFEPPQAAPVFEQTSSVDWQAGVEHAARFGHSIARLAIHDPAAAHQETFAQGASASTAQNATMGNGLYTLQLKENAAVVEAESDGAVRQENHTGLPDALKAGVETLSGLSLNDVQVHYNSSKPAQVQALAYTQGTEIHMGPGQEQHLPHEAWHVVQQKQERVKPTLQARGVAINDDQGLEREADVMGDKAVNEHLMEGQLARFTGEARRSQGFANRQGIIQAKWIVVPDREGILKWNIDADGVQWYTDGDTYWFEIIDQSLVKKGNVKDYFLSAGEKNKKTWEEWRKEGADIVPKEDVHFGEMLDMQKDSLKYNQGVVHMPSSKKALIGMEKRKPFRLWLFEGGPEPKAMNCWEAVLYASYKAGLYTKENIIKAIEKDDTSEVPYFAMQIINSATLTFDKVFIKKIPAQNEKETAILSLIDIPIATTIPRGFVIIFGDGLHAALSTGTLQSINNPKLIDMELNQGHGMLEHDQGTNGVSMTTVEEAIADKPQYLKKVSCGPLPQL